jgi:succinyl-diaminopimelate desuccinylase
MSSSRELLEALIRRQSVTPEDAGCQPMLAKRLEAIGFNCEQLRFGEVDNLFARRGTASPLLVFLGHTDVVPTGPEPQWSSPPFEPTERNGHLYGRGAADMKSGVACMLTAMERFIAEHPDHSGSLGLLLTSDEEGPAVDGVRRVMQVLQERGEHIDYCVVGEPSSKHKLGDIIRVGRRGSLNGTLRVIGKQGHTAYPELADNPIHRLAPALAALLAEHWDNGGDGFPPTSLQVSNINAGTGATNIIPGELSLLFNFRYAPCSDAAGLQARAESILDEHNLPYELDWHLSGEPFVTLKRPLIDAVANAIEAECRYRPEESTGGGTSDGRFVAPTGSDVVEIGPINASIHQIDEHIRIEDIDRLSRIYEGVLQRLLLTA